MAQLNEHVKKIMYKSGYLLETPSYRPIIDDDFEKDDQPNQYMQDGPNPVDGTSPMREVGEDEKQPDKVGAPQLPGVNNPVAPEQTGTATGNPVDQQAGNEEIPSPVEPEPTPDENPTPANAVNPTVEPAKPDPNEIQNEIIKQNIEVMKQLNAKITDLEKGIEILKVQSDVLAKDVDEVREPTNVEKLMSKKEDSHPYYYGLNDMWKNNWFQARRDELKEKGMKQLPDGSYIADFDQLPQFNNIDIKDSFDNY